MAGNYSLLDTGNRGVAQRMTTWATCTVKTGREPQIAMLLAQRDREVYFPLVTVLKRPWYKRRPIEVATTAIPGHLFMRENTIGNIEEFKVLEGFHYFLRTASGNLSLLQDYDIDWMRENLECTEEPSRRPLVTYKLWDRVRIPAFPISPFSGYRGKVMGLMNRRIWVGGGNFVRPVLFRALLLERDNG